MWTCMEIWYLVFCKIHFFKCWKFFLIILHFSITYFPAQKFVQSNFSSGKISFILLKPPFVRTLIQNTAQGYNKSRHLIFPFITTKHLSQIKWKLEDICVTPSHERFIKRRDQINNTLEKPMIYQLSNLTSPFTIPTPVIHEIRLEGRRTVAIL